MSSEDSGNQPDQLESLIAIFLEAEKSGEALDRDALIDEHAGLADSLREFFANHDRMKATADLETPTLPPTSANSDVDAPTLAPHTTSADTPTLAPNAEPIDPPKIGEKVRYFGDYELLEEIARGGMGVVYKARQVNLNRIVALKMILSGQFAGEEDVQRFYTEAEAAASLDHSGIVPIFEIGEHAGQHYFSMGYIVGDSLAQRVADGPLPPREAAELIKKICDAMAYAHERGVIHRDLKPANILIDSNGQPKVTDFGLAKKAEADSGLTGTGQILGTPAYMPPEQASGKTDDVGPLADVYSLGAILYCLLTGRPPFQAASPMDTLLQVLDKEPVAIRILNPQVPRDLETICLKCLSKETTRRYESAADLGAELQRYVDGEPIYARPAGSLERSWRWCRRNPTTATLIAFAAALLLTGTTVSTYFAVEARIAQGVAEEKVVEANRERERADQEKLTARRNLYVGNLGLAQRAWEDGQTGQLQSTLDDIRAESDEQEEDLRGFEYYYWKNLLNQEFRSIDATRPGEENESVSSIAIGPDGKRIASAGNAFGKPSEIKIWDATTGRELVRIAPPHRLEKNRKTQFIGNIVFSPDGLCLVQSGRTLSCGGD